MKYALIHVREANYHDPVVLGPFESDDEAREYLTTNYPTYTRDEEAMGEEYEDGDRVIVLTGMVR